MSTFTDRFNKAIKEQDNQAGTFTKFFKKLEKCDSYVDLREVLYAVKDEEKKLEDGGYLFSREDGTEFWTKYNEIKAETYDDYIHDQENAIAEVEALIVKKDTENDLKAIKRGIYREPLLDRRSITRPLYDQCDEKIAQIRSQSAAAA